MIFRRTLATGLAALGVSAKTASRFSRMPKPVRIPYIVIDTIALTRSVAHLKRGKRTWRTSLSQRARRCAAAARLNRMVTKAEKSAPEGGQRSGCGFAKLQDVFVLR